MLCRSSGKYIDIYFSLKITYFVIKTQHSSIYDSRFEEFMVPLIDDFIGGDRDEILLCPVHAVRWYVSWTEQYHPGISSLSISTSERKKQASQNINLFWIRLVINHT